MCDLPACSREHVPPQNLFPESSDVGGENYRVNLITVPSCDLHNSAKSHDDEFLMVSLAGIIGNNSLGYRHKFGKVDRAIRRSANRLLNKVIIKKKAIHTIEFAENKFIKIIWGTPDIKRLNLCFDRITRGLYFHHFGKPFKGRVNIHIGYLFHEQPSPRNWSEFIHDRTELDLQGKPCHGANPAVFFYQVTDSDQYGLLMVRLCFYGSMHVYAALSPDDATPPRHLAVELMKQGVKTIFTLGDKTYEINNDTDN